MKTKPNHNHKVGDIVKVYHDPVTATKLEGEAKIVKLWNTSYYYDVEFLDDEGTIFSRFVY